MAKQTINVGTTANDRKGDSLRAAFQKVNANFSELYTALGLDEAPLNLGAFEFTGSTISTTDSSAITVTQAVTIESDLTVGGDILPSSNVNIDLGSATARFRDLYLSSNTIYLGATTLGVDSQGNLLIGGQAVADVGTAAWANITGKPTFATVATSGAYADLSGKPTIPTAVSQLTNDSGFITAADIAGGTLTVDVNNTGDLKGSVFGDDSTLLVDATNSSIPYAVLSGAPTIPADINDLTDNSNLLGSNPFDQDLNTTDNPQFNRVGLTAGEINVTAGTGFNLYVTPDGVTSHNLNFNTNGDLRIPGGIKSENNIDIEINLSDSTLRRWQFGEDGNLNLAGDLIAPGGITANSLGIGVWDSTPTDYYFEVEGPGVARLFRTGGPGGIATADFAAYYSTPENGQQGVPLVFRQSTLNSVNDVAGNIRTVVTDITNGSVDTKFEFSVRSNDAYVVGGSIDGSGFVGNLNADNGAGYRTIIDQDSITAVHNGTTIFTIDKGPGGGSINTLAGKSFAITTDDNSNFWTFGTDGNLTLPGDIRSQGNINIDINLSDSTLRRWTFGEDGNLNLAGNLTFPDGTVQTTATPTELTPFIRSGIILSGTSFTAYGITIAMSGSNPYTITAAVSLTVGGDSYISSPNHTGGISTTPTSIFTITGAGQSCTAIISDLNTFAMYRVTVQNMVVNDPAYELTMVAIEQMRGTGYGGAI